MRGLDDEECDPSASFPIKIGTNAFAQYCWCLWMERRNEVDSSNFGDNI